ESLSKIFAGSTIDKYFSSEVNYLKDKILLSLFNHNMSNSKRNQIQRGILIVEVLAAKGFRKEALKKLKAIKKSAIKQEEFMWILRLIELEEIILFKEGIIGYRLTLETLHKERKEVTRTIENLNEYHILRQELRELQFSDQMFTSPVNFLKTLSSDPLILDSHNCMSIKAKEHWFYIQVLANYLKRNFESGLMAASQHASFIFENNHLFAINKVLPVLSNYMYHAALTRSENHFLKAKSLLKDLASKKGVSQFYLKYIIYTRTLEFAYYTGNTNLSEQYLEFANELLQDHAANFEESQIQYLFMLVVRAEIELGRIVIGMKQCNLWQRRGILPYRKVQARLFSLMINFELNHFQLISSEIVLLKKLQRVYVREKGIIEIFYVFFKSILKNPEMRTELITRLQQDLYRMSIEKFNYFDFISFDYHKWSLRLN
ncbi:hypothetical protein N9B82_06160, partial [Saprospiraceae bacterium]|nr:hypothetical protein [Saprospiraceae bacterium]